MKVNSLSNPLQKAKKINKIRQRYISAFLALFLVLVSCFGVLSAHESGNVLSHTLSFDVSDISFTNLSTSAATYATIYNYDVSNPFGFNKYGYDGFWSFSGITRVLNTFRNISFTDLDDYNYIVFELSLAAMSSNVLVDFSTLYLVDSNYNYITLDEIADYSTVTLNINGVDLSGVQCYFIAEVSDFSAFTSTFLIQSFSDLRLSGVTEANFPIFTTPLTVKFYKNYQDVIVDVNNNVQQIINQNDIIINNLTEVKGQLNNIHNSLNSNNDPANPELDSNVSIAEDVEKEFADRFNDFIDPSFKDDIFNKFNNVFLDPKFLSAMIFVRDIFDSLFFRVPVLGILFAVGGGAVLVAALFGIASRALSDRHDSSPSDSINTRFDIYKSQHYSSDRYNDRR